MNSQTLNVVPIEYIGTKAKKTDTITGSGITWDGPGNVQQVPVPIAQRLLEPRYADIWRLARTQAISVTPQKNSATSRARGVKAENKIEDIISAIAELLSGDDAGNHLDDTGAPRLESLSAKLGRNVTLAERDAAWAEVMKEAPAA